MNKIVKDHKLEHKYKTPAAKLKYVQKVLKLEITYDENKNPGVVFNDEDPDVKKVKFGRRLSRSKVQSKEVGNAEEMEIEAEKASSAVACKMEEKGKDSWQNRCDVEHVGLGNGMQRVMELWEPDTSCSFKELVVRCQNEKTTTEPTKIKMTVP